jgi:hypothetical protein
MKTLSQIKNAVKSGRMSKLEAIKECLILKEKEIKMQKTLKTVIAAVALDTMTKEEAVALVEREMKEIDYDINLYR